MDAWGGSRLWGPSRMEIAPSDEFSLAHRRLVGILVVTYGFIWIAHTIFSEIRERTIIKTTVTSPTFLDFWNALWKVRVFIWNLIRYFQDLGGFKNCRASNEKDSPWTKYNHHRHYNGDDAGGILFWTDSNAILEWFRDTAAATCT